MLLTTVLIGQLASALEHGHGLVYRPRPPALPARRVDGIEVCLRSIAGQ
ncbi:hypothetical protein ACCQ13_09140 [Xanthomonas sp. NCPPB 1638]